MNMKKIYKQISKKHGVSVSDVKRDMQAAINAAYANPTFYADCVVREKEIPTPAEFVRHLSNRVSSMTDSESDKS
ncbi:MAG: sporulation initiation factor Spo0A C-terminal domain-containing protein [Candidatus Izemoplasmatales bacterium]